MAPQVDANMFAATLYIKKTGFHATHNGFGKQWQKKLVAKEQKCKSDDPDLKGCVAEDQRL